MKGSKLTAVLLSALLTVPFPCGMTALAEEEQPVLHLARFGDPAMQRQALAAEPAFFTVADGISAHSSSEALPAAFDLRSRGLVSSVKAQDPYGTCWAFAAINSVENSLIARIPDIDLSEWHLSYYTYCNAFGYPTHEEELFDEGSYDVRQEAGMLTAWAGPVDEEDARYGDASIYDSQKTLEELREEADYHVTSAKLYPLWPDRDEVRNAQIEGMKRAIYSGQALDARYMDNEDCFNEETNAYFYDHTYCDLEKNTGHVISIVGWDDAFPASSFCTDPGSDGAWLVKNSWGCNWGEYGYFWLSYNDISLNDVIAFTAEPAQPDQRLYQYDTYGNHSSFAAGEEGEAEVYAANVFTAGEDGFIESVMLCNMVNDDTWDITIYTGVEDENAPTSGKAAAAQKILLPELGYQTIALDTPVPLRMGERFSIVARISGKDESFHIPCEYASHSEWRNSDDSIDSTDSTFPLHLLMEDFHEGESFYSADGAEWFDIYLNGTQVSDCYDEASGTTTTYTECIGNICMKAVTRSAGAVIFSDYHRTLPAGTPITLSCSEGAPIYYAIDGGSFQPYTEPIVFEEAMTLSAYADTGEHVIYTQDYEPARASLSSLLCIEDYFCWYADELDDPLTLHYCIFPDTTSLKLMPVSTGTVTIDGQELPSGQVTEVTIPAQADAVTILVEQEGLAPAAYTLVLESLGQDPGLRGDVTLDGEINASDAARILIYSAAVGTGQSPELPDEYWTYRADFNGDDQINASDAALILTYSAQQGVQHN